MICHCWIYKSGRINYHCSMKCSMLKWYGLNLWSLLLFVQSLRKLQGVSLADNDRGKSLKVTGTSYGYYNGSILWIMTEQLHFHFSLSCTGEGNGNPLQCSCLENPRDGRAWWAAVYGVAQSQTQLKQLSSSSSIHHLKLWSN